MEQLEPSEPPGRDFAALGYKTEIGRFDRDGDTTCLASSAGAAGFLLFGPYILLAPGHYLATFNLAIAAASARHPTLRIDVCGRAGEVILAERTVVGAETGPDGSVALAFEVEATLALEFRLFALGNGRTVLRGLPTLSRRDADGRMRPSDLADPALSFQTRNGVMLQTLAGHGAVYGFDRGDFVMTLQGVSLVLRTQEDFQLVVEVLLNNDYRVEARGETMAIDIGMNVGLASLALAATPGIVEVHGFEPFRVPYERARRNLALNPALAGRITAYPFGIGGADERLEVHADPDNTIGTSIRGTGEGVAETIEVRAAPAVLGPLLHDARRRGRLAVMKIDCEGSEFAILASLQAAGLLPLVDVIMMEWHKWWSPGLGAADLVRPLIAEDFVVFDRTSLGNPHAGMIYAVRRAGVSGRR